MDRCRELALEAPPGFQLPDLDGLSDGVVAVAAPQRSLLLRFHDSADFRLARWGASLLHDSAYGWLAELAPLPRGILSVRRAFAFADSPTPPAPVLDLLSALVRGAALEPRAALRVRRTQVDLVSGDEPLARVVLDEAVASPSRGAQSAFTEVQIDLDRSTPPDLRDALAARLAEKGAAPIDPGTRYGRALGRARPAPELPVPAIGLDASAAAAIRAALAASTDRWIRHDAGVRLGEDDEDVHQARVATRRLRSDLGTFQPLLDPDFASGLRTAIRPVARALGRVRDADVMVARLRDRIAALPEDERGAAEGLLERLARERAEAREAMQVELGAPAYLEVVERCVVAAREPALLPEADGPASERLGELVHARWRRLVRRVRHLGDEVEPEAALLHRIRIDAKRTRYAAEAAIPVSGKRMRSFARALAELQEVLGEHQDAAVARTWLHAAATRGSLEESFVAGALATLEAESGRAARERFRTAWKRVQDREPEFARSVRVRGGV
jgi:CHAD domain-containing protein